MARRHGLGRRMHKERHGEEAVRVVGNRRHHTCWSARWEEPRVASHHGEHGRREHARSVHRGRVLVHQGHLDKLMIQMLLLSRSRRAPLEILSRQSIQKIKGGCRDRKVMPEVGDRGVATYLRVQSGQFACIEQLFAPRSPGHGDTSGHFGGIYKCQGDQETRARIGF